MCILKYFPLVFEEGGWRGPYATTIQQYNEKRQNTDE